MVQSAVVICLLHLCTISWGQSFNTSPVNQRRRQSSSLPRNITPQDVREAFARATETSRNTVLTGKRRTFEPRQNVPEFRHQSFSAADSKSRNLENKQEKFEEATRVLQREFTLTPKEASGLAQTDLKTIAKNEVQECESQSKNCCRQNKRFRTFDGTCNNLKHCSWGMASSCFERLVEPDYADGIAEKRVAMSGNPLPAPRRVSLEIHNHLNNPSHNVNHMFMVFGQFLDHDISATPVSRGPDNEFLVCCPVKADNPPTCDPILIDTDDSFFKIDCLGNVRSAKCATCKLGPREQINQITAYIDASHIYGLNQNESRALRSNDGSGTLKFVTVENVGELPPGSFAPNNDFCSFQDPDFDCFQTGDRRANQHPALTSLHVIFLREHNRIARRLRKINPRWNDERLYQEARRIVGAEINMITYNEFLLVTIGAEGMDRFDLNVRPMNQYTQYDKTVQATLVNEFPTAAYRFGHSMVNSFFPESRGGKGDFLRDIFNWPFGLYRGQLERMIEGLTDSSSQKFDRHMVRDLTNYLYQARGSDRGLDLASLNVNRGRDHGIPGYTTLVKFCGGPVITTWRQLDRLFQKGVRPLFQRLYERVEDIDLFSGGLAERPNQGAVIGPTFTCIIGIQFKRLKFGDRFYFEHGGQTGSFTPAQLNEIKKITLAKILCDNSKIEEMSENAFLFPGNGNPSQRCKDKAGINLNAWRE